MRSSNQDVRTGGVMAARFEVFQDRQGRYRFRLKAGNGEIIAASEAYSTRSGAIKGIDAFKRAAQLAEVTDRVS
jgi:uncharacterized protein